MGRVVITFEDVDIEEELFSVDIDGVDPAEEDKTLAEKVGLIAFYKIQTWMNTLVDVDGLQEYHPDQLEFDDDVEDGDGAV